jgi:hypothetical protein
MVPGEGETERGVMSNGTVRSGARNTPAVRAGSYVEDPYPDTAQSLRAPNVPVSIQPGSTRDPSAVG